MRKLLSVCVLLAVSGCQQQVVVPTAQELIADPQLLTEWQAKCNTGEYTHLPAGRKDELCFTTQSATISVAEKKVGDSGTDFYRANTRRK